MPLDSCPLIRGGEKLFGDRIFSSLGLPENGDHPPARPIEKQLKTVDAAGKRRLLRIVPRFVRAEHLHNIAVALHSPRRLFFVKAFFLKERSSARDVFIRRHGARKKAAAVFFRPGWNEPRPGQTKRAEAVPIASLSRRARDHLVGSREDRFGGGYVSRLRRWWRRRCLR